MFLTNNDLTQLTGLKRPSAIRRWLKSEGFKYAVGADNWPRVLTSAVTARLGEQAPVERVPRLRLRSHG